ncbi:hypothetical protein P7K49_030927 [Saguinus oedipus]|uniref:Uncharacterized protein n=1 Tax=Saguinus oedipus TaxID=9490 RepID=A0ABQ9U4R4_SAGOE|nr:hypothetical protein P7K49_030927 [Saguinus oedipus]
MGVAGGEESREGKLDSSDTWLSIGISCLPLRGGRRVEERSSPPGGSSLICGLCQEALLPGLPSEKARGLWDSAVASSSCLPKSPFKLCPVGSGQATERMGLMEEVNVLRAKLVLNPGRVYSEKKTSAEAPSPGNASFRPSYKQLAPWLQNSLV